MTDSDCTLTSPLSALHRNAPPLLALTIVWHPERARVGEQYVTGAGACEIELCRYAPLFGRAEGESMPLGHAGISRNPVRIVRDSADCISISLPASRMLVELNGKVIDQAVQLDAAAIAQGQILLLGGAVVLCLHWMRSLPRRHAVPSLIGVGSAAIAMRDQIELVATTDTPVLLLGETGTGKEVAARAIHTLSRRRQARMVTVNMAALNESLAIADLFGAAKGAYTGAQAERQGLFAEADGGTLFLDEIGNAPASVQPMLLRVLEGGDYRPLGAARDRHSTARMIAATDQNLDAGGFNPALLRRLEGFIIELPALRARREDIGVLLVHVLESESWEGTLPADFVNQLACYHWPGNIRQLVHTARRALLQLRNGMEPQLDALVRSTPVPRPVAPPPAPAGAAAPAPARKKPSDLNDKDVLDAMMRHAWTIRSAAESLSISRPSFYKLLENHPEIRSIQAIPAEEIERAMAACAGDLARCADLLKTPVEPLRRHVRRLRHLQ